MLEPWTDTGDGCMIDCWEFFTGFSCKKGFWPLAAALCHLFVFLLTSQSTRALLISSVRQLCCLWSFVLLVSSFWLLHYFSCEPFLYLFHPFLRGLCFSALLCIECKTIVQVSHIFVSIKAFSDPDLPQVFFDLVRQVNKTAPSRRQTTKKKRRCCPRKTLSCPSCCRICWSLSYFCCHQNHHNHPHSTKENRKKKDYHMKKERWNQESP